MENNNIAVMVSHLLDLLNVKYAQSFLVKTIEELPYNTTLWGIMKTLKMFGVRSEGLRIPAEEISNIQPPYVAKTSEGLMLVTAINPDSIKCFLCSGEVKLFRLSTFLKIWEEQVLLPKNGTINGEFQLERHRNQQFNSFVNKAMNWVASFSGIVVVIFSLCRFLIGRKEWMFVVIVILLLSGLVLSILLLREQMHLDSGIAHRLCGSIKNGNCQNVIHSNASKIWGGYSWSEIGFSYFISCLAYIVLTPNSLGCLAILSFCALPYTIWSVAYQKFMVRQWCVLCLLVQLVFALLAVFWACSVELYCTLFDVLAFGFIFLISVVFTNSYTLAKKNERNSNLWERAYKKLKYSNGVFERLCETEIKECTDYQTSVVFGNRKADARITIFSNMHCLTCAKLYEALKWVDLERCSVCYYFTTLTTSYEEAAKMVIACYQQYGEEVTKSCLNLWYKELLSGVKPHKFNVPIDYDNPKVEEELLIHKNWMKSNDMIPTPVIFVNGHRIPSYYTFEDLIVLLP